MYVRCYQAANYIEGLKFVFEILSCIFVDQVEDFVVEDVVDDVVAVVYFVSG